MEVGSDYLNAAALFSRKTLLGVARFLPVRKPFDQAKANSTSGEAICAYFLRQLRYFDPVDFGGRSNIKSPRAQVALIEKLHGARWTTICLTDIAEASCRTNPILHGVSLRRIFDHNQPTVVARCTTDSSLRVQSLDLRAQCQSIKPEIDAAIARVLESSRFVLGSEVAEFEQEFAAYWGPAKSIALNSGTRGLTLSLWQPESLG